MEKIQDILNKYPKGREYILSILQELQSVSPQNHISEEVMQIVAEYLNVTQSAVYGVAEYYSMLSVKPRKKNIVRVCNSLICNNAGSEKVIKKLADYAETDKLKDVSIEKCECLGLCNKAPSILFNDIPLVDINEDNVIKKINSVKK